MKKRLLELRRLLLEVDIPVTDKYKLIMFNQSMYTCFSIAIQDPFDINAYSKNLTRGLLYYLSIPFVSFEGRINFVYSFYESYRLYDKESILATVTDPSAVMYDDSIEALLGRALAILRDDNMESVIAIFDNLEDTLQKSKNVI